MWTMKAGRGESSMDDPRMRDPDLKHCAESYRYYEMKSQQPGEEVLAAIFECALTCGVPVNGIIGRAVDIRKGRHPGPRQGGSTTLKERVG